MRGARAVGRRVSSATPKLDRVQPTVWGSFRGLSLLYDLPGSAALNGVVTLEQLASTTAPPPALYQRLGELAEGFAQDAREAQVAWAPLPRHSYHVTLCDAVNDGNRSQVHPQRRDEVAATLRAVPDSLHWSNGVVRLLREPELRWSVWRAPVTFAFEDLHVWGHALVARLAPLDAPSRAALASHRTAREELVARLRTRLGVAGGPWRPHLTLGYCADDGAAAHLEDTLLPAWRARARAGARGATVRSSSASLYAFTDMASFWRWWP